METQNEAPVQPEPAPVDQNADNEKLFTILTHITPLAGYLFPAFGTILAPLIWWVIMKDKYEAVRVHGTEVLNMAISYTIYTFICIPFVFILIGIPLLIALYLGLIICIIIGAVKASGGELFRYPLTIRFIKDAGEE